MLTACGTSTDGDNANESLNEQAGQIELKDAVVGLWEIEDPKSIADNGVYKMNLYAGGTGDGYDNNSGTYSLTWEIKDDVINISQNNSGMFVTGYTLEGDNLASVDGKKNYKRVEE